MCQSCLKVRTLRPSTTRVVPVTQLASSDARNTMHRVTSFALATRRIGIPAAKFRRFSSKSPLVTQHPVQHLRMGLARTDSVHADTPGRMIERHATVHLHDGTLAGAIGDEARFAVDTLKPGRKTRDIRDSGLKESGVRILPSGRKSLFLHCQIEGRRIWHAIGDAEAISLEYVRSRARTMLALRPHGDEAGPVTPILFETVAEEVLRRYGRHWKPRTLQVNLGYYRKQIQNFRDHRVSA